MPFSEDLSQFFRAEDFATAAVFSRTAATIYGILDAEYREALGMVQSSSPVFVCRSADVPGAVHGDTLTIGAAVYRLVGVEPDGLGVTMLRLERQ